MRVKRGYLHWYWTCFPCSEGFAHLSWREVLDSALEHAKKPEHREAARPVVKVRRDGAFRNWSWSCKTCDTGGSGSRLVHWKVVLDAAHRHSRSPLHREKVARGRA